MYNVATAVTQ